MSLWLSRRSPQSSRSQRWVGGRTLGCGNRCELFGFEGAPHGFYNWGAFDNKYFVETMRQTDEFLISLKYLSGKPTIKQFVKANPASKPG